MKNKTIFSILCLSILFCFSCRDDESGDGGSSVNEGILISINPVSKFEGDETVFFDFTVKLNEIPTTDVTVDFTTEDITATAGNDYIAKNGTLTFSGVLEQTITIEIIPDTIKEADEEFKIQLSNANASFDRSEINAIIRNDDTYFPGVNDGYITADSYPGMSMVWQDEFDGTELDLNNWTYEIGTGNDGWGNNELQYYTDRPENSFLTDGKLVIEAKEEDFNGSDYTSARMITLNKQDFQFGRVDIRAKLPEGQGIWPALWMLGSNIETVSWPACGEIDIMELVGHEPGTVHGTGHFGESFPSTFIGNGYTLDSGKFSDEYHVFSIVWEFNLIRWYVDDQLFFTLSSNQTGNVYPFNNKFFFIFNVAVGGQWPGSPDASTVFPQRMYVDYVRVFQ